MARRRTLEDKLARVAELRDREDPSASRGELSKFLTDPSAHVVAAAAAAIAELGIPELAPELEAAIEPFYVEPEKTDKGCIAKTSIIKSLAELEAGSPEIFLRGLHHVQLEPAYGRPVDTAVELRCESALGLAASGYPDTVNELVSALTDPEAPVRLAAVRTLAATGRSEVEPLLRYKTLVGDEDLQVVSDALESLLVMAPRRSLPLAERLLDSPDDAMAEAAALALGASRSDEAFELLSSRLGTFDTPLTQTKLLAISMLRREEPIAFLMSLAETAPRRRAESVVKALAIHRYDPRIRERLEKALKKRKDRKALLALAASEFAG